MLDALRVDFSPALVSVDETTDSPALRQERRGRFHVGWFLLTCDVKSASVRYRCFHIARVLEERGIQHSYFTDADKLCASMKRLDAVVVVKRLDLSVIKIVARARELRKAVFLDICDDLLAERYSKNAGGIHRMVFAGVAPLLDGIVAPSAAMAERMKDYRRDLAKAETPVHVIPDIAETEDLFRRTAAFATGTAEAAAPYASSPAPRNPKTGKTVLWFGNFGAPHSNFGMASLLPALSSLRAVHKDIPLELVIVSNDETVYQALIASCGIPARYVPWSAQAVYSELQRADVALLTNGDDEFCTIKSSNRVLQALAMDVPVVATGSTAFTELIDCMFSGNYEGGLRAYLGPDRDRHVAVAMTAARGILDRYRPEKLGNIWFELLARRVEEKKHIRSPSAKGRLLFLIEAGDESDRLGEVLAYCKKKKLQAEVVATVAAFQSQPHLREALISNNLAPTVIAKPNHIYPGRLFGVARLIIANKPADIASCFLAWAKELGVPVLTLAELRQEIDLAAKAEQGIPSPATSAAARPRQPGPYSERLDPDGSAAWVFVVHQNNEGWILDAICREIGSRQPDSWKVVYNPPRLPPARNYFFSHYSLFPKHLRRTPRIFEESASFIWYTHPRAETPEGIKEYLHAFEHATQVIFTCGMNRELWLERGLNPAKGRVVLGGADPKLFEWHERGEAVVGLSSSFYERKNPDCLLKLIKLLPHRRFHLIGRSWEQYALFEEMKAEPNFTYLTIPYEEYPQHYREFDVFLSMSTLEGGPIPLLEAMMCNAVPVASCTGFSPDLIRHGENGFLFDIQAPAEKVASLIEAAFSLKADIRETVIEYNWDNFSRNVVSLGR